MKEKIVRVSENSPLALLINALIEHAMNQVNDTTDSSELEKYVSYYCLLKEPQ